VETAVLLSIMATFFLAGTVKGVIGLGLPTVSLAVLTVLVGLPQAMTLLLAPSLLTNLWQAMARGGALVIVKRLWPFLLMATLTIWIGAFALTRVDLFWLSILLGMLLIIYSLVNLAGFRPTIPARHEIWTGAVAGVANGLLTGMTGSFVVPGVLYLQAISLPRDTLVQAMGILFTLSTIALSVALAHNGWLSGRLGLMSIAAVMPAMAGMLVGQRIRKSLSENLFRKIFYISLLMLGLYIVINTSVIGI
jgi:uncharacterized membrane protein YfcA